jgi:hypothetical protein
VLVFGSYDHFNAVGRSREPWRMAAILSGLPSG